MSRARGHRLKRFGAAAIDREFGLDAFLREQVLPHRRFGDGGRPIGLGGQADADRFFGLRACRKRDANGHGPDRQRLSACCYRDIPCPSRAALCP